MNKKILLFLICFFSLLPFILQRNDYFDITNVIHINSIGLDYQPKENTYECYFYVFNNFNLTNAKISSSNIDDLAYVVKTKGKSFNEAFLKIYQIVNNVVNFSHLKTIILSTNYLNQNCLNQLYDFIINNNDFYYNFSLLTSCDSFEKIYNINNFSDFSAYHTILTNQKFLETYNRISFKEFSYLINNESYFLMIPQVTILENNFFKQDEKNNLLEINGYSIFQKQKYLKTLTFDEEKALKWLINLKNNHLSIDKYNLYIKNSSYKMQKKDYKTVFSFKIEAILLNNPFNMLITDLEQIITNYIKIDIESLYYKYLDHQIDLFNLEFKGFSKELKFNIKLELN